MPARGCRRSLMSRVIMNNQAQGLYSRRSRRGALEAGIPQPALKSTRLVRGHSL